MRKHVLASMVAAATMGFFTPLTSHAFGLGKIEVKSALNEPFKAEIGLTALRAEEKDNLQVKLASEDEFKRAGLDRSLLLNQLQFDIIERGGQDKILVTSKQSIKEPFLDFLLAATAGSGVLIREYTVLLDPPEYVMAESRSSTAATSAIADKPVASTEPTTTRYQYAQSSSGFDGSSYDVKRSDTLWNVALATRPSSSVSVHQMMMALLKANPTAFNNNNVNGLKAGVTLQIPSQSDIQSLSKTQAQAAFAEQNEAWKNRNQPAVTTVTENDAGEESQPEETNSAENTTEQAEATAEMAEDVATSGEESTAAGTPDSNADAHLQLVAPEDDVSSEDDAQPNAEGNDELKRLNEQLTLAQETIEAQTQENIDFKSRMDAMEEQLETMRRLISLKDADMARLQSLLEEEDPALAAEAASVLQANDSGVASPASDPVTEESMAGDKAMPTEEMSGTTADENTEQNTDTDTDSEQGSEMSQEQADDIVSKTAKALNMDEAQVQSTVDKVKQFVADNKLPVAAGLLLILLVLWLIARRSNREVTWDEAVQKMDKGHKEETPAPTVVAPVQDESITDAPLEEEPEQEKTVGELVEQADMFVGYADYVQARTSLEQARAIEPNNTLVAYKTLFVMYKQNQTAEFVELAENTPFDKDSLEWSEIKQWGQELDPGNELFNEQAAAAVDTIDSADTKLETDETSVEALSNDADEVAEAEDNHLEFDLNDFAEPSSAESAPTEAETTETKADVEDDLLAFDTNLGVSDNADTAEDQKNNESLDIDINDDDTTLSFDADTNEPASLDLDQVDTDSDSDPDLQFDIGDLDEIDEAETKLDLAAAYIDMGDPDGARSILNEVISEGSDEQKNRAQELLNSLS